MSGPAVTCFYLEAGSVGDVFDQVVDGAVEEAAEEHDSAAIQLRDLVVAPIRQGSFHDARRLVDVVRGLAGASEQLIQFDAGGHK